MFQSGMATGSLVNIRGDSLSEIRNPLFSTYTICTEYYIVIAVAVKDPI